MIEKVIENRVYKAYWTDELSESLICDYSNFHKEVFHSNFTYKDFMTKFVNNIYGISIHVFVYENDTLIALRSLWRNDIDNILAYQPCDTVVSPAHRGGGIFKYMTDLALTLAGDALIYNYPNDNSRKLYLRNGWEINRVLYKNLYTKKAFFNNCPDPVIPDEYVRWYFAPMLELKVRKVDDNYLLLSPRGKGLYVIMGRISKEIYDSGLFKKSRFGLLFFRSSVKSKIGKLNHPAHIVARGGYSGFIPFWKVDAI